MQNVFYKIQTNIGSLRDAEKLNAWIYSIARNSIIDFYRTQRFETEAPEDMVSAAEDEPTANFFVPRLYICKVEETD